MNITKTIKQLFKNKKLAKAFQAVKFDMEFLEEKHHSLKMSTDEWIMFLDQENRYLKMRVKSLEKKLDGLEDNYYDKKLSVLKTV